MKLDKLKDKRLFEFCVTAPGVVDKENDVVPADEIMEAMNGWMIHGAPMSIGHSNNIIGRGINFYKDHDGKIIATGLIHEDSMIADDVWKGIKEGKYKSVSIGGAAFEKTPNAFGGDDLKGLEILEVAVCEEGMHQDANILSKNDFAKGTPFFTKATIKTGTKPDFSLNGTTVPFKFSNKNLEVKKMEMNTMKANPQEVVNQIMALLQQLVPATNGPQGPPQPMGTEGPPEPVSQSASTMKQEGGNLGTKFSNPETGAKVSLPKSPDDERTDQGVAGSQAGDKGESILEKFQKEITELRTGLSEVKKLAPKTSLTPSPIVQKGFGGKSEDPSLRTLAIAQGREKVDWAGIAKSKQTDRLRTELRSREEFENHMNRIGGGF